MEYWIMKEIITPEIAAELLKRNKSNRPIKKAHVRKLVNILQTGAWIYNGETIKVDIHGNLIDGQHRCMAIVSSGIAAEVEVIRDLPPECVNTIDQGKKRTLADLLAMDGNDWWVEKAALTRHIYFYETYKYNHNKIKYSLHTSTQLFEFYKENASKINNTIMRCKHLKKQNIIVDYSKVIFVYHMCAKIDVEMATIFIQKLVEGVFIEPKCPIGALRHYIVNSYKHYQRFTNSNLITLDMIFRAWNMWRYKTQCTAFKADLDVFELPDLV
jgi:hypothetical protein